MPFAATDEFKAALPPVTEEFKFAEDRLERLRRNQSRPKTVCVIGGGIAGLTAAYELLDPTNTGLVHKVVLVEATERLGGRVWTWHPHKDQSDLHGEFGAMRVPPNHHGTMHYIDEVFKLAKGTFVQSNPNAWCQVGDHKERRRDFGALLSLHGVKLGRWYYKRGSDPRAALFDLLEASLGVRLKGRAVLNGKLDPTTRAFDRVSLWQFLREIEIKPRDEHDTDPNADAVYARRRSGRLGHSKGDLTRGDQIVGATAWELLSRASGQRWRETLSALEEWVESAAILGGDNRIRLVAGMDALPNAFVGGIEARGGQIIQEKPVTRVTRSGGEHPMHVYVKGPGQVEEEITAPGQDGFDYVVCAAPASATARISFNPPLPAAQSAALTGIPYQNAAKYLLHMKRRRWENDPRNPIFGGASYTDRLIQQCWYPSDNVRHVYPAAPNSTHEPLVYNVGAGDQGAAAYTIFEVQGDPSPHAWERPAVLTAAYMTGVNADRFISLTKSQRKEAVLSCLDELHPGIRDDVCCEADCAWMEQTTPGGGAWTLYEPGGRERYWEHLRKPHPVADPRVFFAGEHLSLLHGWIQSAIQSSIEAVMRVLEAY
ncbi:MAG TPA: FAD-dependent oxidoreductase [Mycobacterium sp.]|nr:FAD-dependent oxidoreductase [Mycobacterium sp.]HTX95558.1 FAD-dependent oxidoreductase [Mycobacterium sp.]